MSRKKYALPTAFISPLLEQTFTPVSSCGEIIVDKMFLMA